MGWDMKAFVVQFPESEMDFLIQSNPEKHQISHSFK
jgi:hypothetical protein